MEHLRGGKDRLASALAVVPADQLSEPPRPGEWTVKQTIQHLSDDERIYAYRTLRFARGDSTDLPGFDEQSYSHNAAARERPIDDLVSEFGIVRDATVALFEGLPDHVLRRTGTADGHPMSVRAAAFHITGHELDHLTSIHRDHALRESY